MTNVKLRFNAVLTLATALAFGFSTCAFGGDGYFLDHDDVRRQGGVGNYVFRYYPGPHKKLSNEPNLAASRATTEPLPPDAIDVDLAEMTDAWDFAPEQAGIVDQTALLSSAIDQANAKLYFDPNSASLRQGREDLANVASILADQKGMKLEVDGFADAAGGDAYNLRLSHLRAEAVTRALVSSGVPRDRIVVKAWGESRQVPDTNNRRVILRLPAS